jgi:hypothetical protein
VFEDGEHYECQHYVWNASDLSNLTCFGMSLFDQNTRPIVVPGDIPSWSIMRAILDFEEYEVIDTFNTSIAELAEHSRALPLVADYAKHHTDTASICWQSRTPFWTGHNCNRQRRHLSHRYR